MSYYSNFVIDACEPRTIALTSNVKYSLGPNDIYYILVESSDSESDNDSIPEEKAPAHCSRCAMRD